MTTKKIEFINSVIEKKTVKFLTECCGIKFE